MRNRKRTGVFLVMLAQGIAGCGPTAPSPLPTTALVPPAVAAPRPLPVQVRGTVHDGMSNALAGAEVQAWSGPEEAGAISDGNGEFVITLFHSYASNPYVGTDQFHAFKAGYVSETLTLDSGLNFVLAAASARASDAVSK